MCMQISSSALPRLLWNGTEPKMSLQHLPASSGMPYELWDTMTLLHTTDTAVQEDCSECPDYHAVIARYG